MSADPTPLHRLMKILYIFFLRVLYRLFSTKPQQELDDEARIDLPVNIIYGEKLPAWMTEPPKGFKEPDSSQPLRHSEEWAQQKANFLRSPGLKKKYTQNDANVRARAPYARFSDFLVANECSQDSGLPPTIRIEDWSTPSSPEVPLASTLESFTVTETSFPPSKFVSSSSRDSLIVPPMDSPGFKHGFRTSGSRRTMTIGTGKTCERSHSDYNPEQIHGCKIHDKTRRQSPIKSLQSLERNCEPDESALSRLVRPARTSKTLLSPSLIDLLQTTSSSADRIDSIVQQAVQGADKQNITARQDSVRDSFLAFQSLVGVRVSRQRQPSIILSSGAADVPYPCVFDLDEYFHTLSSSPVPATLASLRSTSQILSPRNRSHDPVGTPTPSPRTPLSNNILVSIYTSGPTRTRRTSQSTAQSANKCKNEHVVHKAAVRKRNHFPGSFDTGEKQQLPSRFSVESSLSGDPPLSSWLSRRLQSHGRFDKRKGFIDVTKQIGATLKQHTASVNPDMNPVLNSDPARRTSTVAKTSGQLEIDRIRTSSRSHYMLTQRRRNSFSESSEDDNSNSLASLLESYSSGSTLSYHHQPHQWTTRGLPSPRYDRRLDPAIEATSESGCSSSTITPKTAPSLHFGSDDIITVDRTPPRVLVLPPHRTKDSTNKVSLSLGLGTQQSKTARGSDRHRWLASNQSDRGFSAMNESALRMQKIMSTGALTENSNSVVMTGSKVIGLGPLLSAPPKPAARRVIPQKF